MDTLSPMVKICIPPVLRKKAEELMAEMPLVHPAWSKVSQHGRHFVLQTSDINDIEELADWAQSWLMEPSEPLDKVNRQAFHNVITRVGRYVHLRAIGKCHFLACGWKPKQPKKARNHKKD